MCWSLLQGPAIYICSIRVLAVTFVYMHHFMKLYIFAVLAIVRSRKHHRDHRRMTVLEFNFRSTSLGSHSIYMEIDTGASFSIIIEDQGRIMSWFQNWPCRILGAIPECLPERACPYLGSTTGVGLIWPAAHKVVPVIVRGDDPSGTELAEAYLLELS